MFSTHERLKKKTPEGGIGRREFIEHLVEEFHTSTNSEAQEQVTANLANFAYDPINWKFLQDSAAVELFLQLLSVPNERLQLHGVAGLCNIGLDPLTFAFIGKPSNFLYLAQLYQKSENIDIAVNCVTLFWYLLKNHEDIELRQLIASPDILKRSLHWKQTSNNLRIKNICTLFLEDFGTRVETLHLS